MPENKKTALIIQGPTAVGKTAVAIAIAQRLGTVIISADSRQCYAEMNIGTAQPTPAELAAVQHYFIAEYPITTNLTAADYEQIALGYLEQLFKQHDTVVVCGGTGLYIKALCEGLDEMPPVNKKINDEVEAMYALHGIQWLQEAIKKEDSNFYNEGEIHNPARLIRALVFVRSTGKSILDYRTNTISQRPFTIVKAGLELPRETMYARINKRVDAMMAAGLLEEATTLYPFRELKNLQTVGYSELFSYIACECTLQTAIDKIKQHTRNYAKRQLTWFKKDKAITWFMADEAHVADSILELL